jgi:hypothetical protein
MEFKSVVGFEGKYEISSCGTVRSIARMAECGTRYVQERIISLSLVRGYLRAHLSKAGKTPLISVHRLVALTWLGTPPESAPQVNHKNGNKTDNRVENLEWVSCKENITHACNIGLRSSKGEANPKAKLNGKSIAEIRSLAQQGQSTREIASNFGVGVICIQRVVSGRTWARM